MLIKQRKKNQFNLKNIYILNIEFLNSQDIRFNLSKFYGLGFKSVNLILKLLGVSSKFRLNFDDLNEDKLLSLKNLISERFIIEGDLIRLFSKNIDKIKNVNCYKKLRFKLKLPVNGQRPVQMRELAEKKVCSIMDNAFGLDRKIVGSSPAY